MWTDQEWEEKGPVTSEECPQEIKDMPGWAGVCNRKPMFVKGSTPDWSRIENLCEKAYERARQAFSPQPETEGPTGKKDSFPAAPAPKKKQTTTRKPAPKKKK